MHHSHNGKFDLPWTILHPGDFYASAQEELVSTVLGSCVAVVLFDQEARVSGMNHFMLPGYDRNRAIFTEESGRYGVYAMDLLVNAMVKKGARRDRLMAKVFGGGHVINQDGGRVHTHYSNKGSQGPRLSFEEGQRSVPESNIHFALEYLRMEGMGLLGHDLGGNFGRRVYLFSQTGKVLLSRITPSKSLETVAREERDYLKKIQKKIQGDDGTAVLF